MIKEIEIDKVKLRLFDDAGVIHPYLIENSPQGSYYVETKTLIKSTTIE